MKTYTLRGISWATSRTLKQRSHTHKTKFVPNWVHKHLDDKMLYTYPVEEK